MEFSLPLWGEEEDVSLSWLPLRLALGHDRPVGFASLQPQPKKSAAAPTFCCSVVLFIFFFSDTDFVASLMLHLCNLFISLARHGSVPPTPPSPLNFQFFLQAAVCRSGSRLPPPRCVPRLAWGSRADSFIPKGNLLLKASLPRSPSSAQIFGFSVQGEILEDCCRGWKLYQEGAAYRCQISGSDSSFLQEEREKNSGYSPCDAEVTLHYDEKRSRFLSQI